LVAECGFRFAELSLIGSQIPLAGLLVPSARGRRRTAAEVDHAEMAMAAGGTVLGDESE